MMYFKSITSSSSGNCATVFTDKTKLLIDAGTSVTETKKSLPFPLSEINGVLITHEHSDHVKSLHIFARTIPIYIVKPSLDKLCGKKDLVIKKENINLMIPGKHFFIGDIKVLPISVLHDSVACVGFVFNDTFAYMSDTGNISSLMRQQIRNCKSIFLDCDYDEQMLEDFEGYDMFLKERIKSNFGHLSIFQVKEFLAKNNFTTVILGHLSPRTNSPELVKTAFPKAIIAPFDEPISL